MSDYLKHYGVLGMKWGIRRYQPYPSGEGSKGKYTGKQSTSRSIKGMMAKRANAKVDKGFKDWEKNANRKTKAIESGKKANLARLSLDQNKGDKAIKAEYKQAKKDYKKDLKSNTAYRKGQIRQEVGKDLARKYLSKAKKLQKEVNKDPNNRQLIKEYNKTMDKYNIERSKARKAAEVGAKRSRKIASMKRAKTMAIKGIATTAAIAAGTATVNAILKRNGGQGISTSDMSSVIEKGKKIMNMAGYFY